MTEGIIQKCLAGSARSLQKEVCIAGVVFDHMYNTIETTLLAIVELLYIALSLDGLRSAIVGVLLLEEGVSLSLSLVEGR
jgi:hypothetical protein